MPSKIPPDFEPPNPLDQVMDDLMEYASLNPERLGLDQEDWLQDFVKFSCVKDEFRKATK